LCGYNFKITTFRNKIPPGKEINLKEASNVKRRNYDPYIRHGKSLYFDYLRGKKRGS